MSKKLLMAAALVAIAAVTHAALADGFRDAGAKMRGDFGGMTRRNMSQNYYYRSAPLIVRAAPAQVAPAQAAPAQPPAVAQAPTQRRSFSVEPQAPAATAAPAPAATYYVAPARGYYRSSEPSYMYQKSDPRRYGR